MEAIRIREEKAAFKQDSFAFLRAKKRVNFSSLKKTRENVIKEDKKDRFIYERKGKDQVDTINLNPHRVQMFSIEEIWKAILKRLVDLNVMRDPDDDHYESDNESTDLDDEFDFVHHGQNRVGRLFKDKRCAQDKEKALKD
jgi:hypothetical protein